VNYADLDLASDAGVQVLYRRLQVAAQRVCRVFEDHMLARSMKRRACYDQALSEAVAKVDLGTLTALHKSAAARPRAS
jgi:UrcA family protein